MGPRGFPLYPLGWLFCLPILLIPLTSVRADSYPSIRGPCGFAFPRDHGAHPDHRTEWWYYTGNLTAASGKRYGFQLTIFRSRILPPGGDGFRPRRPSAWRTPQVYFAHAALSDLHSRRFYYDERMARAAVGLSGARASNGTVTVFVGPWSIGLGPRTHRLKARTKDFSLLLTCVPLKAPVAHGVGGYSIKGKGPESASCYYSFTRLDTSGTLTLGGKGTSVQGTAWMDHEFSSAPLEPDLMGWDWFSIQFSNRTELMIYQLRNRNGGFSPSSSGTFVGPRGRSLAFTQKDFRIRVMERWKSPVTGAVYPARWRIRVVPQSLDLHVRSVLGNQELVTRKSTQVTYWEGSVSVTGTAGGKPVDGLGYAELTGYAGAMRLSR